MVNLERALRTRTGPKHGLVGEPAASGRQSKAQYHLNAHGRRTHPKQGWGRRSNLVEAQGRRAHPKQGWDRVAGAARPRRDAGDEVPSKPFEMTDMVFLEICAGSAVLSSTIQRLGLQALAIDHEFNRFEAHMHITQLDLAVQSSWENLMDVVREGRVVCVHAGPPCGTCSEARGIPLADGSPGPPPLRAHSHPEGLPNLQPWDLHKVTAANKLYAGLSAFVWELTRREIPFTIENPTASWLWELPCMTALVASCEFVHFHNCAYGGARKKATSFLTNHAAYQQLARECPGDHKHEAWGQDERGGFNTAKEAEYPTPLCSEYAHVVAQLLQARGIAVSQEREAPFVARPHSQGKRSLGPQLIAEYKQVRALKLPSLPVLDAKSCLAHELYGVPAGSKLLRAEVKGGKNRHHLCIFGVYHTDREFLDMSRALWHPYDELVHLPDRLIRAIHLTLTLGKLQLAKHRLKTVTRWQGWAAELQQAEASLKRRMEGQVAEVLKSKRLLLLAKIAEEIDWPDRGLHKEIREGFRLVGKAAYSGVFKRELKSAPHTEEDLRKRSKFLRPAILGRIRAQQSRDTDDALYELTLKEAVEKGWMHGPLEPDQVTKLYGDD